MKSNVSKKIIDFEKINISSQTEMTLEKIIKNEIRSSPVCEVVDTLMTTIFNQICETYSFEQVIDEIKLNTTLIYNSIDNFLEYVCVHIIKDFHIEYHIIDDIIDIIQHHFNINIIQTNFFRKPHYYKKALFINLNANEQKIISVQSFNKLIYTYITHYNKIDPVTSNAIYRFIELLIRLFIKYNYVIQFTNEDLINLNALSASSRITIFHKNNTYDKKIIKLIKLYKKFNKFCLSHNWVL